MFFYYLFPPFFYLLRTIMHSFLDGEEINYSETRTPCSKTMSWKNTKVHKKGLLLAIFVVDRKLCSSSSTSNSLKDEGNFL